MERAAGCLGPVASCSYSIPAPRRARAVAHWQKSSSIGLCRPSGQRPPAAAVSSSYRKPPTRRTSCQSAREQDIQGVTPAQYVTYSSAPEHACRHLLAIEVNAPAELCWELWDDWNRLVDYLDLISQIGLDKDKPGMALVQAFYRHGKLPTLEIVFVVEKTTREPGKSIKWQTVWGMPAKGEIKFVEEEEKPGKTLVSFQLEHQLPDLLVDLSVTPFWIEPTLRKIFNENLQDYKALAETIAGTRQGEVPPRRVASNYAVLAADSDSDEEEFEEVEEEGSEVNAAAAATGAASPEEAPPPVVEGAAAVEAGVAAAPPKPSQPAPGAAKSTGRGRSSSSSSASRKKPGTSKGRSSSSSQKLRSG